MGLISRKSRGRKVSGAILCSFMCSMQDWGGGVGGGEGGGEGDMLMGVGEGR